MSKKTFPKPLSLRKLIGPSFIILALGLGSGEVILWPYLASNYGLGIAWGAVIGITFQYFINMEIERYALVKGESVFVGISKFWKLAPAWFIFSTFLGFGIPGIIAASAKVLSSIVGFDDHRWVAIGFLVLIGLILSAGKTVYGMMERITKTIILLGVPFVFILVLFLTDASDWISLGQGIVGIGEGYRFMPEGIVLATFLGAFAYAGAGGNLNLTQSIYIKEKGYGMGKYAQKISGLFTLLKKEEALKLEGERFEINAESKKRFHEWFKRVGVEHAIVFWFIGALSILLLMILAYSTTFGIEGTAEGINFVIFEGSAIGSAIGPWAGVLFLVVVTIMLFQTQLGVMDSTSRIMAENLAITKLKKRKSEKVHLSKIYSIFVWAQIAFGSILFLLDFSEPKTLIVLGAVINAFAMFVHVGLVTYLNHKALPKFARARVWRKVILASIFIFFGFFSAVVLIDKLF